jgi:hypothetical protein
MLMVHHTTTSRVLARLRQETERWERWMVTYRFSRIWMTRRRLEKWDSGHLAHCMFVGTDGDDLHINQLISHSSPNRSWCQTHPNWTSVARDKRNRRSRQEFLLCNTIRRGRDTADECASSSVAQKLVRDDCWSFTLV